MNEAYLKKRLKESLRVVMPGCVVYRHEDKFSGGVPDLSVTWGGVTSWIEVKYEKNGLTLSIFAGANFLTMRRSEHTGQSALPHS